MASDAAKSKWRAKAGTRRLRTLLRLWRLHRAGRRTVRDLVAGTRTVGFRVDRLGRVTALPSAADIAWVKDIIGRAFPRYRPTVALRDQLDVAWQLQGALNICVRDLFACGRGQPWMERGPISPFTVLLHLREMSLDREALSAVLREYSEELGLDFMLLPRAPIGFPASNRDSSPTAANIPTTDEASPTRLNQWAAGERVTLAIVFTDVVGSTSLSEEVRDHGMKGVRQTHFASGRGLIAKFAGQEVKTLGDGFMAVFRSADRALDFALALQEDTGDERVKIRVGIHIGPVDVEEDDVFGSTVAVAARVVNVPDSAESWVTDHVKNDIDRLGAMRHQHLEWICHPGIPLKGFSEPFTLWSVKDPTR